jgi:uncharacterized protein YjbJ (UPF0337 family)
MAAGDKARGKARASVGRARKRIGEETGDPYLAQQGRSMQRRGNIRLAWEKLKDAFRR